MLPKNVEDGAYQAVLEGLLEIDNQGRIWRLGCRRGCGKGKAKVVPCKRRRAESPMDQYLSIRMMYNYRRYQAQAHRMVYRHFNGVIPDGLTVNHINGHKHDNRPSNLELATWSEQALHAFHVIKTRRPTRADASGTAKLNWDQVHEIRQRRRDTQVSISKLARDYDVSFQAISKIVRNEAWTEQIGA